MSDQIDLPGESDAPFVVSCDPAWCKDADAEPVRHTGWLNDPLAVARAVAEIEAFQRDTADGGVVAAALAPTDDGEDVLFWKAEEKVFGRKKKSWNQGSYGTCVSFGWGRAINDLIVMMVADGLIEWPGADVATEPIYAGSRVEVGRGGVGRGDGSTGAWAAKWVEQWGTLLRKVYGQHDLTSYSGAKSRQWGMPGVGCPDDLEPTAKEYPVKKVVQVTSAADAWTLLGNRHAIPICSNVGFESPYEDGFCAPRGSWPHCMEGRGRVMAKRRGSLVRAFPIQNSWGGYIQGDPFYIDRNGNRVELPEGCFLCDEQTFDRILRQRDSFAIADQRGFARKPKTPLDWYA